MPLDKTQRGEFFVLEGLRVFQARKVRVASEQCHGAACPVVQITSNYPSTGLYFRCYWQQLNRYARCGCIEFLLRWRQISDSSMMVQSMQNGNSAKKPLPLYSVGLMPKTCFLTQSVLIRDTCKHIQYIETH